MLCADVPSSAYCAELIVHSDSRGRQGEQKLEGVDGISDLAAHPHIPGGPGRMCHVEGRITAIRRAVAYNPECLSNTGRFLADQACRGFASLKADGGIDTLDPHQFNVWLTLQAMEQAHAALMMFVAETHSAVTGVCF